MADIGITKYRARVIKENALPSNPGNPATNPVDPVNPPASGGGTGVNQFIQLTDTPATYSGGGAKAVAVKSDESGLEFVDFPTVTGGDEPTVKTTASADQNLPSGVLTILDFDTTLTNNATLIYSVATDGRITVSDNGVFDITAGVVIEANAVTALESAFLGIFRNGDLIAISSNDTTVAAGNSTGLSCSTQISLLSGDIIDCRVLVNSVGGVANGIARRLGLLLGSNATQVNSLTIVKCISNGQSFTQLSDTPSSYSGATLNYARVNAGETGLEFRTPAQVLTDIGGIGGTGTTNYIPKFTGAGTIGDSALFEQNGGLGISTNSIGNFTLRLSRQIGGASTVISASNTGEIQTGVVVARIWSTGVITASSSTITRIEHFQANGANLGSGSSIGTQWGFYADASLGTNSTISVGFFGNLASGSNKWNLFMQGTANNYLAGNLYIGTTSGTETLDVNGTARIRTINNLGSTPTEVLVPSATGVVSKRTLAELASDGLGSKWTDGSGFIYRDGPVVVGRTTLPTNATFAVQSKSATNNHKFFQLLNNIGTELASCTQVGVWNFTSTNNNAFTFVGIGGSGYINPMMILNPQNQNRSVLAFNDGATNRAVFKADGSYRINNGTDTFFELNGNTGELSVRNIIFQESRNITTGTTTGTKIGTATSEKIGFWNATPIIQPDTSVAEGTFVENLGGTIVNVDSTFDGYTLQQVVRALRNTGLLA